MTLDRHTCYQAVLARDARYDGKFFTCARTTRIYCRPICPGKPPKFANCFFVGTAAAAHEAGCRPCIRCRPESSPDVAAWAGTSAVVSRAMRLIENGALDTGSVAALADRLGLGERHVRRLFAQHLGASPISVAQTRRVLLAKQFIHETSLSMTEIALASGFGSVRRFNETLQTLFKRPPAALRKSSANDARSPAGLSLLMSYRPPYDWKAMLELLRDRLIRETEVIENNRYSRVFVIGGSPGLIEVENVPDKHALGVNVRVTDLSHLPDVLSRLRRLFDLRSDPVAIDAALMRSADLAPLVRNRPGIRIPGAWDDCELFLWTLLECRFGRAKAAAFMTSIAKTLGVCVPGGENRNVGHAFPDLLHSDLDVGDAVGLPVRASVLLNGALSIARRSEDILQSRAPLAEALRRLLGANQTRRWAEEYLAMRVIRDVEACPLELQSANGGHRARPCQLSKDTLDECRPWLSYAAAHIRLEQYRRLSPDAASARPRPQARRLATSAP